MTLYYVSEIQIVINPTVCIRVKMTNFHSQNIPRIDDLLSELEKILDGYKPNSLVFLNSRGNWRTYPNSVRDRISNELLHTIWKLRCENDYLERVKNIILPLVFDKNSWSATCSIFDGIENSAKSNLLVILEVLYRLIEYNADRMNSEHYVSEWDSRGKAIKAQYEKRTQEFFNNTNSRLSKNYLIDAFNRLLDSLKESKDIFCKVVRIITDEDRLRQGIDDWIVNLKDSTKKDEIFGILSVQIYNSFLTLTDTPQALLRPCLELLENPDIEITSGLQYEAATILSTINDSRSTNFIINALQKCDYKYTILRCCLIYAIGNLKQKIALEHFMDVLKSPAFVLVKHSSALPGYMQSLDWEKREAVLALGKLGADAVKAIPLLAKYSNSKDRDLKLALAWAMGTIGKEQKAKQGGIDADVVITLLHLLVDKDNGIFEESAFALKHLGLPDFIHSLYLHNISTIPILSLKPSSTGLYELSETLMYLMSLKNPVVMAVTGDSGTGKTYFCQSILGGFGKLQAKDIIYLQRDNPAHMKLFDRMLGLEYLKKHIDSSLYDDYMPIENVDKPDKFFDEFINKHGDKKLIILDGWRDDAYFEQIIKIFYEKGFLDVAVNFQTTYSTKRLNLEKRERGLERVRNCLSCTENPMKETRFYREGKVLIYNLDNSISSRLNSEETIEVFRRKKVKEWGDYIRIGRFEKDVEPLEIDEESFQFHMEDFVGESKSISLDKISHFSPDETSFSRILNEDIKNESNLLQIIKPGDFAVKHIAFYMPGQIAFCDFSGNIGIFSGLNDRIIYTQVFKNKPVGIAITGEKICSLDVGGNLRIASFHDNSITDIIMNAPLACSIISNHSNLIITGHHDGSIRTWDINLAQVRILNNHNSAVSALAIDRHGRIFSGSINGELRIWDIKENRVRVFLLPESPIGAIDMYPDGRIAIGISENKIGILNFETGNCQIVKNDSQGTINAINAYFDGRIIVGMKSSDDNDTDGNLTIHDPRPDIQRYKVLGGHRIETRDCLTMGPRIITYGRESDSEYTLRIWGTESYVKTESEKLKLLPGTMYKPAYYRTVF